MDDIERNQYQINIKNVFISVLQEKWLILLVSIAVALSAFIYSKAKSTPVYSAYTTIYVLRNTNSSVQYADIQTAAQLIKDYEELIKSFEVAEQVVDRLNLKMSPSALKNKISVSSKEDTRIITIAAVDTDPYRAAEIANAVREVASVSIVEIMRLDAVNLVSEARIPTDKTDSGATRNTMLAFVFAIAMSIGVITVLEVVNDTIKTPEDIVSRLDIITLGAIPYSKDRLTESAAGDTEGDDN